MKRAIFSIFSVGALSLMGFVPCYADGPPPPVPEPATFLLVGMGAAGLAVYGLIRKRRK